MARTDWLDLHGDLLGPHAEPLDQAARDFARDAAKTDPSWYLGDRTQFGDPYGEFDRIVKDAEELNIRYAAERVAIATAAEGLGFRVFADGPAERTETAEEVLLGSYGADLGGDRAERIKNEAADWASYVDREDAGWVLARARELAEPYPPREIFDREVGRWAKDNLPAAAALLAIDRAKPATPRVEVAPAIEAKPEVEMAAQASPAVSGAREPDPDPQPPPSVRGPEIAELVKQRADKIVPHLEERLAGTPSYRRGRMAVDFSEKFRGRRLKLIEEIQASEAARDGVALDGARTKWIELHARLQAVDTVVARATDRERGSKDREREPEGGGIEMD